VGEELGQWPGDVGEVEGLDEEGCRADLPAAVGAEEPSELLLDGSLAPPRLSLEGPEGAEIAHPVDDPLHRRGPQGSDQLVLQVFDADVEAQPLQVLAGEVGAEASSLQSVSETALLAGVAEAGQPDVQAFRTEPIQERADVRRASHRHDGHTLGFEITVRSRCESLEGALVALAFDEHDRTCIEGSRCLRIGKARLRHLSSMCETSDRPTSDQRALSDLVLATLHRSGLNRQVDEARVIPLPMARLQLDEERWPADRPFPIVAHAVTHRDGVFLFDTGIGTGNPEIDELIREQRSIEAALAEHGISIADVTAVANCHLHADHGGQNWRFAGRPIFVQRREWAMVHEPDYTVAEWVDAPGLTYEILDGEADVAPGIRVIPTPGHVAGHQSLVVETVRGPIVIAGQAVQSLAEWEGETDEMVTGTPRAGDDRREPYVASVDRLRALDPVRVHFVHDPAVWERGA
jgi:N-acyl homoserine lactone hydrolase